MITGNQPRTGHKGFRMFRIDPIFNGVTMKAHLILGDGQGQARRHAQLFFDQINARDGLGDAVFHLQAGVHFNEIKLPLRIQKLKRAGAVIPNIFGGFHRNGPDVGTLGIGEGGGGGFLQNLLVAALQGTITLPQMNDVAVLIPQQLNFDVTGLQQIFFHVHIGIAKVRLGLDLGQIEQLGHVFGPFGDFHALAAAAARGLHQNGKTNLFGERCGFLTIFQNPLGSGDHGNARADHGVFGADFIPHHLNMFRRWPDEG